MVLREVEAKLSFEPRIGFSISDDEPADDFLAVQVVREHL